MLRPAGARPAVPLHLREIVDFAVAEGLEVDLTNFVHWPAELSVRNLPAEHKAEAGRYLDALIGDCRDRSLETAAEHLTMLTSFVRAEADREAGQEAS